MKLWGGRFKNESDAQAWALNASIGFDRRLAEQDVRGSLAWAEALQQAGVLEQAEREAITEGLQSIAAEFEHGAFRFQKSDEDIHTAVERRLGELIGPLAGKLHSGRSRNDQVATDFRLWLLDQLPVLDAALAALQAALIYRAESDMQVMMPGYTHLQRAQAITLSHWWLSQFWPLQRDRKRLSQCGERCSVMPLGSGALAGVPFPVDRHALAESLDFSQPSPNSIDAVSDRDFAAEFLFCAAMTSLHLSKLAEGIVLFSSAEFGFFELDEAYASGSSLMPQKKNPDVFELARGKAGRLLGLLTGLLATLKALPSAYDKDLQEDKVPVFQAYDTLIALLPVLEGALRSLSINPERMRAQIDESTMATDLADYLVEKGVPFREAHELSGKVILQALELEVQPSGLPLEAFQSLSKAFGEDVYAVFNPLRSVERRSAFGGTAPSAVAEQLERAKEIYQTN